MSDKRIKIISIWNHDQKRTIGKKYENGKKLQ